MLLFRSDASSQSFVENNRLIDIADQTRYANRMTVKPVGPERPLKFRCGVDGWKATPYIFRK